MKLRLLMLMATVLASGIGLGATQRYFCAVYDVDLTDARLWKQLDGGGNEASAANEKRVLMVMGKMSVKDAMVRKLVSGEITLQQAAARFVEVNKDSELYFVGLRSKYTSIEINEAVYRNVLEWVEANYETDPNYERIRERLENELEVCRKADFPLPLVPLQAKVRTE
ncbi:MAG TPA: hypothetical protein VKS79_14800 [Gemmataceae bacterium]|nr:hypothetical protein [Gemmataceae bacterium]